MYACILGTHKTCTMGTYSTEIETNALIIIQIAEYYIQIDRKNAGSQTGVWIKWRQQVPVVDAGCSELHRWRYGGLVEQSRLKCHHIATSKLGCHESILLQSSSSHVHHLHHHSPNPFHCCVILHHWDGICHLVHSLQYPGVGTCNMNNRQNTCIHTYRQSQTADILSAHEMNKIL